MEKAKARTPLILFPNQRGRDTDSDYTWRSKETNHQESKPSSVSSIFRGAAKKVAGVFTIIFRGRKKSTLEEYKSEAGGSVTPDPLPSFSSSTSSLTESSSRRSTISGHPGIYQVSGSKKAKYTGRHASGQHLGPVIFSFEEIRKATADFSQEKIIGEGSFGIVYKGRLDDGSCVAVKRARWNNYQKNSLLEFKNEIYTLSKIEHLNLVRLYGFLEHGDEKIIVVEYIGNGNLREHLDGLRGDRLEMAQRLGIAIDVAHAITYLHTYTDNPIIHRDIKASNILITEKLRAKVADFGFARLVSHDHSATHISTQVKGSAGYVDPDYLRSFQLTNKSDVYSFGVLLVELVTGRRPIDSKRPGIERITIRWAMQKLKEGEVVVVMDPTLRRNQASNMAAEKILDLARQCLAPTRLLRPSMRTCVEVLWRIRKEFREKQLSAASYSPSAVDLWEKGAVKNGRHVLSVIEDGEIGELHSL